jgi:hypothetical protein
MSNQSAISAESPSNSYCLPQDVVERSRQKSNMLQGEDHVWFEDRWLVALLCDE